jgi:acetyl-CoA carboxylase biotin carboxyl carrier protein
MLSHDDVREILRIIDESDLDELLIETDGFSLHVTKGGAAAAPPAASAPDASETEPESTDGLIAIPSPMLGTFYRAESPGADPLVEIGTEVGPDTTVCIIEVMKMMNSVPAGVSGTVEEVCPANGELVEYGAPLFRVRPA